MENYSAPLELCVAVLSLSGLSLNSNADGVADTTERTTPASCSDK